MRGMKAAMEKGKVQLVVCPMRWIGIRGWLGEAVIAQLKAACYVRAWDPDSRIWWIPENMEPFARGAIGVPMNAPPDIRLEPKPRSTKLVRYSSEIGTEHERVLATRWEEPHWLDSDPYKVLMVDENAPQGLIDSAYQWWRFKFTATKSGEGVGGFDEPLRRVNEAYAEIKRARLAQAEFDRQVNRHVDMETL